MVTGLTFALLVLVLMNLTPLTMLRPVFATGTLDQEEIHGTPLTLRGAVISI